MIRGRQDLPLAQRVVIKAGTSVVSTPEGFPSLTRMANIVEHVSLSGCKLPVRIRVPVGCGFVLKLQLLILVVNAFVCRPPNWSGVVKRS